MFATSARQPATPVADRDQPGAGAPGHPAPPFRKREFRETLGCFPTGVTVVATHDAHGAPFGLTCNSFTSVSLTPPLVLWCLALHSANLPTFLEAPYFSITVLSTGQEALSRRFSSPVPDRFEGIEHAPGASGVPLIAGCAAHLECRTESHQYTGDHVIFIGHVVRFAHTARAPLVFYQRQYNTLVERL